jgi:hypothetical protein
VIPAAERSADNEAGRARTASRFGVALETVVMPIVMKLFILMIDAA